MRKRFVWLFFIFGIFLSNFSFAGTYKVQQGDTLRSISRKYNTTVKELKNLNNLSGELIRVGQKLVVPDSQNSKSTTTKTGINTTTTKNNEIVLNVPRKIFVNYKVKSGDTLYSLARRFNTSVNELKKLNSLKTDNIIIGKTLKVPSYKTEEVRLFVADMNIDTKIYSEVELLDTRAFQLVELAKEYQGVPYQRGGESPYRVDCSGFVRMLFKCFDILLPHSSRAQSKIGEEVKTITVGDLLFFATGGSSLINHVGIYIGDNKFIHASSSNGKVVISPFDKYYRSKFRCARRIFAQK